MHERTTKALQQVGQTLELRLQFSIQHLLRADHLLRRFVV